MRIFDTYVQKLKYKVLTELARQTWVGNDAFSVFNDIANQVVKKGEPTMSCCIYKDRAIVAERIRIALGGKKEDHNVIQVIDIACDECPVAGHVVTVTPEGAWLTPVWMRANWVLSPLIPIKKRKSTNLSAWNAVNAPRAVRTVPSPTSSDHAREPAKWTPFPWRRTV